MNKKRSEIFDVWVCVSVCSRPCVYVCGKSSRQILIDNIYIILNVAECDDFLVRNKTLPSSKMEH